MDKITEPSFDVCVIGGGINGAGIALDAAGRGLKVLLCEKDDIAAHTSSASSKLIHGGLRYLENFEFKLVRESLYERSILLDNAPHLVQPMRFIMPINPKIRSGWLIGIGLKLYDLLAGKHKIKHAKKIKPGKSETNPLDKSIDKAYSYYDCATDDARLVVNICQSAANLGATIKARTEFVNATKVNQQWQIKLKNNLTNEEYGIQAKAIVNAAGPWTDQIIDQRLHSKTDHHLKLVKGSHIVVQKMYEGDDAYVLQNKDNRIIFVVPYKRHYNLIGTTDVEHHGSPTEGEVSDEEVNYLLDSVNNYFHKSLKPEDVAYKYWGVRRLVADDHQNLSKVTRDYKIEIHHDNNQYPIVSVFGGKLTTYRKLAENATDKLCALLNCTSACQTKTTKFNGADFPDDDFAKFKTDLKQQYHYLPGHLVIRLANAYGTKALEILANIKSEQDLGEYFGANLYATEVNYLIKNEWAITSDDILWRRSKLGLRLDKDQVARLDAYIAAQQEIIEQYQAAS